MIYIKEGCNWILKNFCSAGSESFTALRERRPISWPNTGVLLLPLKFCSQIFWIEIFVLMCKVQTALIR